MVSPGARSVPVSRRRRLNGGKWSQTFAGDASAGSSPSPTNRRCTGRHVGSAAVIDLHGKSDTVAAIHDLGVHVTLRESATGPSSTRSLGSDLTRLGCDGAHGDYVAPGARRRDPEPP